MTRWWLRWVGPTAETGDFELHWPWWCSGWVGDRPVYCAAVIAPSAEAARAVVEGAYDAGAGQPEWSFAEERPEDWTPFGERFPRAGWMQWPETPTS